MGLWQHRDRDRRGVPLFDTYCTEALVTYFYVWDERCGPGFIRWSGRECQLPLRLLRRRARWSLAGQGSTCGAMSRRSPAA
jgi:hypothetical protein